MTCLCSQMFMLAESLISPVYASSLARSLRAARLESMLSAFIKSTIDVRQTNFSLCEATALSKIGATSIFGVDDVPAFEASALVPKIAPMIFPKMLICHFRSLRFDFRGTIPLLLHGITTQPTLWRCRWLFSWP